MKSLLPPELQSQWNVRDTVPRLDRLRELAFAGYTVPRCGMFADMVRLGVPLVVYTDELAHCGEGKVLWEPGHAFEWPMSAFCSEYMPSDIYHEHKSCHLRHLIVGSFRFQLDYFSRTSWMSNIDGDFSIIQWWEPGDWNRDKSLLNYPMFAVDFVGSERDIAIDLNVCPGVPVEVVNMVGRDVLQKSVAEFCRSRGLIA